MSEEETLERLKAYRLKAELDGAPEWHVQAAEWLDGEAPRPRVSRREMFEFLVGLFMEDECPPTHAIECLENAGMSQDEIDRFKKYWLNKGLHEGWLDTVALELALGSWSTEKMVRRSIKPYHRTLPQKYAVGIHLQSEDTREQTPEEQLLEALGLDELTEEEGRYLSRIINRPIPTERKRELFRKKFPNQKWLH